MTIQFYCPNCESIIGFDSRHIGKRARCTTCGQIFIIPSKDFEKPQKVKPTPQPKGEPLPGFYRAVFIDSWKSFIDPQNVTTLVFVIAAVCFKFFLSRAACCMNYISFVIVWGWLLGFYLNIIHDTAFELDTFPQINLGTSITFLWYIIKPFLIFFSTMMVVHLPFIIALMLLQGRGITSENMWELHTGFYLLLQMLFILGLFLFPAAILTTAVGEDVTLLRPDYLLAPVFKSFIPYLTVVLLLAVLCLFDIQLSQYTDCAFSGLLFDFAIQIIAIIAMRSIGLFYRHYNCHFRW